jgi:hypothetical protein
MALPVNHPTLKEVRAKAYTTSIGGTPVVAYTAAPVRGRITKFKAIAQGAITTADCALAVAINGTASTACAGTIPVASAAAGQVTSWTPTSPVYVSEDDAISLTPSGASGVSIACMFSIVVEAA